MNADLLRLVVILCHMDDGTIVARGIIQDVTVFDDSVFDDLYQLVKYARKNWTGKYNVVFLPAKGKLTDAER